MESPVTRHRHELKRRTLTVQSKAFITPAMIRIVLESPDLSDFTSLSPDDHVKLFIDGANAEPDRRDYTPRRFDRQACTLTLDFAVHDAGPATQWAVDARPGSTLTIGGPRGSAVVSAPVDWWLLVGDETALPAIGRRIEELPAGARVTSLVAVSETGEQQSFETQAHHEALWVHRPLVAGDDPAPVLDALREWPFPEGRGFVWVASESRVARAVRDHLVERGHPLSWIKAAGYWKMGTADAHESLDG